MTRRASLPKQRIPEVIEWMKNCASGFWCCSERCLMMISSREARPIAAVVAFMAQYSLSSAIVFFLCYHTICSSTLMHIVDLQIELDFWREVGKLNLLQLDDQAFEGFGRSEARPSPKGRIAGKRKCPVHKGGLRQMGPRSIGKYVPTIDSDSSSPPPSPLHQGRRDRCLIRRRSALPHI